MPLETLHSEVRRKHGSTQHHTCKDGFPVANLISEKGAAEITPSSAHLGEHVQKWHVPPYLMKPTPLPLVQTTSVIFSPPLVSSSTYPGASQTLNTLSLDAKPSSLAIVKVDTNGRVSLPVTQKALTQKGQEVQGQKSRSLQATPSHPVITYFICRAGTRDLSGLHSHQCQGLEAGVLSNSRGTKANRTQVRGRKCTSTEEGSQSAPCSSPSVCLSCGSYLHRII